MQWYVSRNGETVGPVDAQQVVAWVHQGMLDAYVRDGSGGPWVHLSQSPFAPVAHQSQHWGQQATPKVPTSSTSTRTIALACCAGFLFVVYWTVTAGDNTSSTPIDIPPTPAKVRPAQPEKKVQPEARAVGIGVARSAFSARFEKKDIGFQLSRSDLSDGTERWMGIAPNGLATLELVGPGAELHHATLMLGLVREALIENMALALMFISTIAPKWKGGADWFGKSVKAGSGETVHDGVRFSVKPLEGLGMLMLTAKPEE